MKRDHFTISRRTLMGGLAVLPLAGPASAQEAGADGLVHVTIPGANASVPVIGVGTSRRYNEPAPEDMATLRDTVARFHQLGGRVIDTAPSYGRAEEVVGEIVEELGIRDDLFIATKVGADIREEGRAQLEDSFRKLRTDYIDLIAVHNLRDLDNQLASLRELKEEGRIGALGITTSFAPQHEEFEAVMRREELDCIQVDYALDNRAAGERILPLAADRGMAIMINLPFGRDRLFEATEGAPLPDWAQEIGCDTWAKFFLKYIVSHPARPIAIPGTARVPYAEDNIGAARPPLPDAATRARMEQFIDNL